MSFQCFSLANECVQSTVVQTNNHRIPNRNHRFLQRQATAEEDFDVDVEPTPIRKQHGMNTVPPMTIVSSMTLPPQNSMIVFADEFELFRDQPVSYV